MWWMEGRAPWLFANDSSCLSWWCNLFGAIFWILSGIWSLKICHLQKTAHQSPIFSLLLWPWDNFNLHSNSAIFCCQNWKYLRRIWLWYLLKIFTNTQTSNLSFCTLDEIGGPRQWSNLQKIPCCKVWCSARQRRQLGPLKGGHLHPGGGLQTW